MADTFFTVLSKRLKLHDNADAGATFSPEVAQGAAGATAWKVEGKAGGVAVGVGVSTVTLPTAIYNGVKTVTTATTRVALATTQALKSGVQIKAYLGNTGIIYVGNATVAAANGYRLNAGESVFLEIADLATVYLDASVSGEGVSYVAS